MTRLMSSSAGWRASFRSSWLSARSPAIARILSGLYVSPCSEKTRAKRSRASASHPARIRQTTLSAHSVFESATASSPPRNPVAPVRNTFHMVLLQRVIRDVVLMSGSNGGGGRGGGGEGGRPRRGWWVGRDRGVGPGGGLFVDAGARV